jgi:carboxyl-terminal processing protease
MHRALWTGLLVVVVGWLPATRAKAAEEATPKTYVVVAGVSDYSDPQIKTRRNAETDAQALYDVLTDQKYQGTAAADAHLLLGKNDDKRHSEAATKDNILKAIKAVCEKAQKDDLVVIALIGQGAPVGDRTAFLASDSTFKDRAKNGVRSAEIEAIVEKAKTEKLCAIIDVNMRGYETKEDVPEANVIDMLRVFVGKEDKEEHALPPGRVVLMANSSQSALLDVGNQSLFMKVLIDGLKGAADVDGYEPDGVITVPEIDTYLEKEVANLARTTGKTNEEKAQVAIDFGARSNRFVLTKNPAVTPSVDQRLKKFADLKLESAVAAEGSKLLAQMPKLKADQELRKAYQKLADGKMTVEEFTKLRGENFAARKLDTSAAEKFANQVTRGLRVIRDQYVKELNAGDMVATSIKGMYRRLDAKIPTELQERINKAKELRTSELVTLLTDARLNLGKREDLESNKDTDIALQMMTVNLDPYTVYIDPEQKQKADIDFRGRFKGIGIQIRRLPEKDALQVRTPILNSPAYKAGLKEKDLITAITTDRDEKGKPLPEPKTFSTKGMKTETAVKHILGEPGTKVRLTVEREGASQPLEFELARNIIEVETVLGVKRNEDDSWDFYVDPNNKIGYIHLTQFQQSSFHDMEEALKKLSKSGLKGLVLDLRGNPGGRLDSAVQISDLFIDDGLIVTIKPRVGRETSYGGDHDGSYLDFPMACLVNGGSASGSEIVSACLQDHKRALIVGERSYGKGSVQNIQDFPATGGEIKLTTATFWRPNGKNLNKSSLKDVAKMTPEELEKEEWGVRPDKGFQLKLEPKEEEDVALHLHDLEIIPRRDGPVKPDATKKPYHDRQLDVALEYLRSQIKTAAKVPPKKSGDKQ